jgi:hypothetical protein
MCPEWTGSFWSRRSDSNRGPADYESAALPTELRRRREEEEHKSLARPVVALCPLWHVLALGSPAWLRRLGRVLALFSADLRIGAMAASPLHLRILGAVYPIHRHLTLSGCRLAIGRPLIFFQLGHSESSGSDGIVRIACNVASAQSGSLRRECALRYG